MLLLLSFSYFLCFQLLRSNVERYIKCFSLIFFQILFLICDFCRYYSAKLYHSSLQIVVLTIKLNTRKVKALMRALKTTVLVFKTKHCRFCCPFFGFVNCFALINVHTSFIADVWSPFNVTRHSLTHTAIQRELKRLLAPLFKMIIIVKVYFYFVPLNADVLHTIFIH